MITAGCRTLVAKTCPKCGELKDAHHFSKINVHYHNSYCNPCKNELARPVVRGHQKQTLRAALKHRQPWTDEELQHLERMVSEGLSGPQMALILNRSVYAVYTMKNKLKETPK